MRITDELREWAHGFNGPWRRNEEMLLAIADRIDAKHEEKVSYWQGACYEDGYKEGLADNEDAMAEHGWVKLPKDADGVPIRVGDVMWQKDRITKRACKAIMGDAYVMLDGIQGAVYAKGLTHYREPTVEDVLREFGDWYAHTKGGCDEDGIIVEYAAKLRLAEGDDA